MERSVLGIGIIGAGNILRHQAMAYRSLPERVRLVAEALADADRIIQAAERHVSVKLSCV